MRENNIIIKKATEKIEELRVQAVSALDEFEDVMLTYFKTLLPEGSDIVPSLRTYLRRDFNRFHPNFEELYNEVHMHITLKKDGYNSFHAGFDIDYSELEDKLLIGCGSGGGEKTSDSEYGYLRTQKYILLGKVWEREDGIKEVLRDSMDIVARYLNLDSEISKQMSIIQEVEASERKSERQEKIESLWKLFTKGTEFKVENGHSFIKQFRGFKAKVLSIGDKTVTCEVKMNQWTTVNKRFKKELFENAYANDNLTIIVNDID